MCLITCYYGNFFYLSWCILTQMYTSSHILSTGLTDTVGFSNTWSQSLKRLISPGFRLMECTQNVIAQCAFTISDEDGPD